MRGLQVFTAGTPLPVDTVTSTLIVYGGKGMGKTNLLSVLLEEMSKSGLRWCVVDPLGVLYGLRYGLDGKSPGVECLILGGVHGDIDIEPTGGEVVADLVADEDVNVIIDCSRDRNGQMWSVGQKIKFLTAFPSRVFQQQGSLVSGRRRPPRFIGLDEAARYIPQSLRSGDKDGAMCVSAWEQIVEEGRNVGLGVGLFTQRSARLNKSVAELADAMIAFRTTGPNSIDAITDWLGDHVEKSVIREHVEVIRKLPIGQALLVSPGWLDREEVVTFRPRETFDSSSTPKPGERPRRISGRGAVVDLDAYRQRMAATIQRADDNDPRVLRKRIKELEAELRKKLVVEVPKEVIKTVKVPALDPVLVDRLHEVLDEIHVAATSVRTASAPVAEALQSLGDYRQTGDVPLPERLERVDAAKRRIATKARPAGVTAAPVPVPTKRTEPPRGDPADIDGAQQRVLDALAWLEAIGYPQPSKQRIGLIAGYRVGKKIAGHYANTLGALRTAGLITYPAPSCAALTNEGRSHANIPEIEPTTEALQAAIFAKLDGPERRVLQVVIDAYPGEISKRDIGEAAGYEVGAKVAGHFANLLGRLRSLGLISYPNPNMVKAESVLFLNEEAV
jgi:uncharacterized protein